MGSGSIFFVLAIQQISSIGNRGSTIAASGVFLLRPRPINNTCKPFRKITIAIVCPSQHCSNVLSLYFPDIELMRALIQPLAGLLLHAISMSSLARALQVPRYPCLTLQPSSWAPICGPTFCLVRPRPQRDQATRRAMPPLERTVWVVPTRVSRDTPG